MRPGINIFDDRIFFLRTEIGRSDDDSPDVGFAVTALADKNLRRPPASFEQP